MADRPKKRAGVHVRDPNQPRYPDAATAQETWRDQVHQGLVGLGWTVRDAERAVEAVSDQAGPVPDVAGLLRAALQSLSKA